MPMFTGAMGDSHGFSRLANVLGPFLKVPSLFFFLTSSDFTIVSVAVTSLTSLYLFKNCTIWQLTNQAAIVHPVSTKLSLWFTL